MYRIRLHDIIFLTLGCLAWSTGLAQSQAQNRSIHLATPRMSSLLGTLSPDTLAASRIDPELGDSIRVFRNGQSLQVVSFRFGYVHPEPYRNDTTGALEVFNNYKDWMFHRPNLDTLWEHYLQRNLTTGDTLYFDRILAKSPKDTLYLAPSMTFVITRP